MSWFNKLDEVVGRAFEGEAEVDSDDEFISMFQQQQEREQRQQQSQAAHANSNPQQQSAIPSPPFSSAPPVVAQHDTPRQRSSESSIRMEQYDNFVAAGEGQVSGIQTDTSRQHFVPPLEPESSMLINEAKDNDNRISLSQSNSPSSEEERQTGESATDTNSTLAATATTATSEGNANENESITRNSSSLSTTGEANNIADVWMEDDPDDTSIDAVDSSPPQSSLIEIPKPTQSHSSPPNIPDIHTTVDKDDGGGRDGDDNNVDDGNDSDEVERGEGGSDGDDINIDSDNSDVDSTDDLFVRGRSMTGEYSNISIDVSTHASSFEDESDDYEVQFPLQPWDENDNESFDPSMNCHGVVHVRIVRAQHLPCSIGSDITANISLPPWKGRVRSDHTNAYLGPIDGGVCVRWDPLDDNGIQSMVHAWNNKDTPVPLIFIELMFHPLPMLEFQVCSVEVSCRPLMRSPGTWIRRWMQTELPKNPLDATDPSTPQVNPLLLLEAVFVPDTMDPETVDEIPDPELLAMELEEEEDDNDKMMSPRFESGRSMATPSVVSSLRTLRNPSKLHLLSKRSFYVPAVCSVCSDVLTGWKRAYRCERCNIDCCLNCQLQVDLQIPCESDAAEAAVNRAIQNKVNMTNILQVVAPADPSYQGKSKSKINESHIPKDDNKERSVRFVDNDKAVDIAAGGKQDGIGHLRLNVIRACVFERPFPPEMDPLDVFTQTENRSLRHGDHYVRISLAGSKERTRTKIVQNTAKPHFDSEEMLFTVPHYGMEYRIELVDALTDKPVGTTLLSAQALLQQQRDLLIDKCGSSSILSLEQLNQRVEKRRTILELRSGVKSGFGPDYFNASKTKDHQAKSGDRKRPCEISGWIEVEICLEENISRLYGANPFHCPPDPPDDLNVELFQIHIARIAGIINDIKKAGKAYGYLVSWENPALTSLSLILFVTVCLRFNAEYFASMPVFFLIIYMVRLSLIRRSGDLKKRFIQKETNACIEAEKKAMVKYSVHRPIGRIEISVFKGKNIRSRELGLTGSVGCRIYYDPLRYQNERVSQDSLIAFDKSLSKVHDIGFTNYQLSQDPIWEISESDETRRLNQLLPHQDPFFETETGSARCVSKDSFPTVQFPLLQPTTINLDGSEDTASRKSVQLDTWSASPGAVVVQVRFHDMLNNLAGFYDDLGEVCIPFSQLVNEGEVRGWFDVLNVGTKSLVRSDAPDNVKQHSESESHFGTRDDTTFETIDKNPQIYLQARWNPPDLETNVSETDREASIVVAEEMIRSAIMAPEENKVDLIGSSIGAFNTVSALKKQVQMIQNILGNVLDAVEKVRNLFNFTDPLKSSIVLLGLLVLWLFLAIVPTRAMMLIGGLAQYAATFSARFGSSKAKKIDTKTMQKIPEIKGKEKPPIVTWLMNSFRGLPTDEDLRRTYFWEGRRVAEREREKLATKKRVSRLQRLWKAEWYASVKLKATNKKGRGQQHNWEWMPVFALVHGRRFIWWQNANDFDNGEAPSGRICLSGHAGLAGLSPLDMRELGSEEIPLLVSVFGRGMEGQQKIMLLMPNLQVKEKLENAILSSSVSAKDD